AAAVSRAPAWSRGRVALVLLVALSLVGGRGSATFSRVAASEPEDAARLRTREEVGAERRAELAAVEAEQARRDALRAEAAAAARAAREAQEASAGTSTGPDSTSTGPDSAATEPDAAPSAPEGASTETDEAPGTPDDEGSRS